MSSHMTKTLAVVKPSFLQLRIISGISQFDIYYLYLPGYWNNLSYWDTLGYWDTLYFHMNWVLIIVKMFKKHHIKPILASLHLFQTLKFDCLSSHLCMVSENFPHSKLQSPAALLRPLRSSHHGLLAILSQQKKSADRAFTRAAQRMKQSPRIHKVGSLVYLNNHLSACLDSLAVCTV